MKQGNIILTVIPHDEKQKVRPVLVLKILPKYNDFLVCAISSQLHQYIAGFDVVLKYSHSAFTDSGLKSTSVFRLANLAVLSKEDIIGSIDYLQDDLHKQLLKNLSDYLLSGEFI